MPAELPQVEPFSLADAARVLKHPETPSAYVTWLEILPLTGREDRVHLGNLLGWSRANADRSLGACRGLFADALRCDDETVLDRWMESLACRRVDDFIDHDVAFLRNVREWSDAQRRAAMTDAYLQLRSTLPVMPVSRTDSRLRAEHPESLILEITRSCNFACSMCSSRTGGFRADLTMPLPLFGDLVRVLGQHARSIRINGYGETSIVPQLGSYLDCLDEFAYGGLREIITNLSADAAVYDDLYARGFIILVSWDAANPTLFEQIRAGARFGDTLNRLHHLGSTAKFQPERLGLLMTVQEANLGEVVPVTRLASESGAGLLIFNMVKEADGSPWMDRRFTEIAATFQEAEAVATAAGLTVRIPDHVGSQRLALAHSSRSSAKFCDRPWRELLVRWDGEATVCNMFNPFSYGQLATPAQPQDLATRFSKLWSGPNARLFRQVINTDHPHPYCTNCYFLYA
jgi:MoaA/NifB/PqqE/SkfB family radical SAM enzyme